MQTKRIISPQKAAKTIREGGLVAFPTETVFGLGVDATNSAAVEKLFAAKGRPSDNPLIVHTSDAKEWSLAASTLTPQAETLLSTFAPGPITVVLPKRPEISALVSAGLETVGLRIPSHPVAREILRLASLPVAAPSANRSGRPSCTTWKAVLEDLDGLIDAVYCEDCDGIGIESTVVDCSGSETTVLRSGAITLEQIKELIPEAQELIPNEKTKSLETKVIGVGNQVSSQVRSPGLLHPHYQPNAEVVLIDAESLNLEIRAGKFAYCGMQPVAKFANADLLVIYPTVEEYAASFYEFLRQADRESIATIYVQQSPNDGIGKALLDRQRRAAGG